MQTGPRGFTLIETLIASFILAAGLTAIASLFVGTLKTGILNRRKTEATIVLTQKMEELKASRPPNGEYTDSIMLSDGTAVSRQWQVAGTGPRSITVRISAADNRTELLHATTTIAAE